MTVQSQKLEQIIADVCKDKNDLIFRKAINDEFRQRLVHFAQHKDTRSLNDILFKIKDPILKKQILDHVIQKLPFKINDKNDGVIVDKTRVSGLTVKIASMFNLMDGVIRKRSRKGVMQIDCDQDISTDEFVSWLADTLTLRRREFSDSQADYLIDILNMIKGQKIQKVQIQERS